MERYKLKAVTADMKDYCHLSKEGDYIEIVRWNNGEGVTANFAEQSFELTWGELQALTVLANIEGE